MAERHVLSNNPRNNCETHFGASPLLVSKVARPLPSSPGPLYQNEVKRSAFDKEMIFHSYANKTHFHKKGCPLGLILKVRVFGTRMWLITPAHFPFFVFEKSCPSGSGSKITASLI